ncbi:Rieske (2Fe-2S) protein [Natrinema sp. 1APR25-10V2]|uniref:Rieske (2Fe-2S) protein n=1 Tax=Natrinema sp. 1APR25-10V2 TaxID=2951081 RepID=UPI002875CF4E|nr:Rieske (2Fe-2S) protein [Natrinema sp. 1APR25-10V2]MDS0474518.1 Rieske (2Fe-2S) protein [Natrinema sp. 1APR25-10V2]
MSGTTDHVVCDAGELGEGERVLVQIEGREIGVFNIDGEYHAYTNWCAHQGGPMCEGTLDGTTEACFDRDTLERDLEWTREGQVLRCPWHAWEFDVVSGECLHSDRYRLVDHEVLVQEGEIVVRM